MDGNSRHDEGIKELRRYESRTLVKAEHIRITGRSANTTKATAITMSMRQARELFESAKNTDYSTRPIELYYGIAAYMRSMTMLCKSGVGEAQLENAHGMALRNIPTGVVSADTILNTEIVFQRGVFLQWHDTQSLFALRVNQAPSNWNYGYEQDLNEKSVTFRQVLGLIPDIWDDLDIAQTTESPRVKFVLGSYQLPMRISFNGLASPGQVGECFPGLSDRYLTGINSRNWNIDFSELDSFLPQLVQQNKDSMGIGSTLVVPPINVRLSPLEAYTVAAYVLSMLSRYRPSIWNSIFNGGDANELYPLVSSLMNVINSWFPYMYAENLRIDRSQDE